MPSKPNAPKTKYHPLVEHAVEQGLIHPDDAEFFHKMFVASKKHYDSGGLVSFMKDPEAMRYELMRNQ